MKLTTAARDMNNLKRQLKVHQEASERETQRLTASIRSCAKVLALASDGLDHEKIALARTVIDVRGQYARAGDDRASVISDVIKQLSTGEPVREVYCDLWRMFFGTKSCDRWHGQRCDCEYGYGPSHGSIIFAIGLLPDVRKRNPKLLNADETEAVIYLLINLERVQAVEMSTTSAA